MEVNVMNRDKKITVMMAIKWIFSFIKKYKLWFLFSIIATGGLISANLLKAYYIQKLINYGLDNNINLLFQSLFSFALIILAGTVFSYLTKFYTGKVSFSVIRDMKNKLAFHITKMEFAELSNLQSGDLASRLNNDTDKIKNFINNSLPQFIVQVLLGIGASIYIGFINFKLLLVTLFFIPGGMYLANYLNKKAGEYYPESYRYLGKAAGEIEQSIIGLDVIKAFNLNELFSNKLKKVYRKVYQADINAFKYVSVLQPVCYALANFPRLITLVIGGYMSANGELEVGTLIAVYHLTEFIIIPAVSYPFVKNNISQSIAAIERVIEIFDIPEEKLSGKDMGEAKGEVVVKFQDLNFGYQNKDKVLNNLNFTLNKSQMTALVGASGSGKSTIVNLLCGLYKYKNGSIKLYGKELNELNLKSIRNNIAVVSQDTYLFPGTISENIGYGNTEAVSRKDIEAAARAANAHKFILELKNGYRTRVTEGGNNLSGGQRQRISLARAFLKNASIIIFDEPTSNLDNQSEKLIQKAIEKLIIDRTVLVIAHRLTTIIKADQIIVLDKGSIVEEGSHQHLVEKKGYYHDLYNKQYLSEGVSNNA